MHPARPRSTQLVGLVAAALLGWPLAACGADGPAMANENDSKKHSIELEPVVAVDDLTGRATSISIDAGFDAALRSGGLSLRGIGTAERVSGALVLPITGGALAYYRPRITDRHVRGVINHSGSGLALTDGQTTVELTDLRLDPDTTRVRGEVTVAGAVRARHEYLLEVDGSTLEGLRTPGQRIVLDGSKVLVAKPLARLVRTTFGTDAVKPRLLAGIATITARGSRPDPR